MSDYRLSTSGSSAQGASSSTVTVGDADSIFNHTEPVELDMGNTSIIPMINRYYRGPKVGGGQHGEVYQCWRMLPSSGDSPPKYIPVAIKAVKRNNPKEGKYRKMREMAQNALPPRSSGHLPVVDRLETTEQKVRKEIAIMKKLRHPHIVRLFEVIDDRLKDKIYMVMEFLAGGEVIWLYEDGSPRLTIAQSRRIIRDAVLGLEYLHSQGIIHRDIKPANLLWTADRTQVKIADFGVSHFSYAQRLAAAGTQAVGEREDAILMDERDLTKLAGTPSFVAPEVVWDFGSLSPLTSQASLHSGAQSPTSEERPKVTKSIDIWGLGVTLYCLLFGRCPFRINGGSEYDLYRLILTSDWVVPEYMGSDKLPTGGRKPRPGTAIDLLDRFLQKDYQERITLPQVKSHPWVIEDLPDPQRWLQATDPAPQIRVTADETDDAMSIVRFKWSWHPKAIATRLTGFFSKPRTPLQRPLAIPEVPEEHRSHSNPSKFFSNANVPPRSGNSAVPGASRPGSRTAPPGSAIPYVASSPGLFAPRGDFVSVPRKDRSRKKQEIRNYGHDSPVSRRQRSGNLSDYSGPSSSVAASPVVDKARSWGKYLPKIPKFQKPSTSDISAHRTPHHRGFTEDGEQLERLGKARRSDERLPYGNHVRQQSDGLLTAARRASSWGQGDEPLEFAEVMSITSSEWMLNDHDIVVGAGGVEKAVPVGPGIAPRSYRPKPRQGPRPETSYIPSTVGAGFGGGDDEDGETPRRRSIGEGQEWRDDASSILSGYGEGGQPRWTDSLAEDGVWDDDDDMYEHRHPSQLRDSRDWDEDEDGSSRRRTRGQPEVIRRRAGDDALDLGSDDDDENYDDEEDDDEEDDRGGGGVVFAPRSRPLQDDELSGVPFSSKPSSS